MSEPVPVPFAEADEQLFQKVRLELLAKPADPAPAVAAEPAPEAPPATPVVEDPAAETRAQTRRRRLAWLAAILTALFLIGIALVALDRGSGVQSAIGLLILIGASPVLPFVLVRSLSPVLGRWSQDAAVRRRLW